MTDESKSHNKEPDDTPSVANATGLNPLRNPWRNPWHDIVLAITFLTRVPLPLSASAVRPLASASWAFPFAGVLTGGIGGGVFLGAVYLELPLLIALILSLMTAILLSGGLHEDGLADVVDGFGGGVTRERKLDIMRDSRIGAYGVLALIFSIILRLAALVIIASQTSEHIVFAAFLTSAVFSRGLLPAVMAALPAVRVDGLSKSAGKPGTVGVIIAFTLGTAGALAPFYSTYQPVVIAMICAIGMVVVLCLIACRQIGGQTGDVIGAAQQIAEIAFLVALSIALGGAS